MENIEITYNTILQIFGAIAVIGGGVKIIISSLSPFREMKAKLKKHDELFDKDNRRLKEVEDSLNRIEDSQRVQGKALMELLNHIITGNDVDKLKKKHDDLVEYYINH